MGIINDLLFSDSIGKMGKKALDLHAQRALLISSNIANVETPGYKAKELKPFQQDLHNAMKNAMPMTSTNARHMHGKADNVMSFQGEVVESTDPSRLDGNNVNIDKEITSMTENSLTYQALITARSKRHKVMAAAIAGQ